VTSEYRLKRRVQFHETDMAGIVHFSCYFRYMEEAEHALWREAGLSVVAVGEEIGLPRVAASCDYHAPLRFEDEFEVWIRVAAISKKTIRYLSHLTRGGTKIATGSTTVVCVSRRPGEPMKAIEFPPDIIGLFQVAPGMDTPAGHTRA
jgi:acyl-CoA thioester hydrolase